MSLHIFTLKHYAQKTSAKPEAFHPAAHLLRFCLKRFVENTTT